MNIEKINFKDLKTESAKMKKLHIRNDWWNIKFYKNNPPNDGSKMQIPLRGVPEIPWERDPFGIKDCRFSLISKPVAYFSNEFVISCCETITQFRDRYNDTWEELLKPYLEGVTNPDPDSYGYPLNYALYECIDILDLRLNSNVLNFLSNYYPKIKQYIISSDIKVYQYTQDLSEELYEFGFNGILYNSVRMPFDSPFFGCNLVLFNRNLIDKIGNVLETKHSLRLS